MNSERLLWSPQETVRGQNNQQLIQITFLILKDTIRIKILDRNSHS